MVGKEGEELQGILDADPKLSVLVFILRRFMISKKKLIPLFLMRKALLLPENGRYREIVERKRSDPYSAGNTLGYQYIVLDVGGKIYTSPLPSSLQLQSGKRVSWRFPSSRPKMF